jgi:hypothetical protein
VGKKEKVLRQRRTRKEYYFSTLTTEDFIYYSSAKLDQPRGWFFNTRRVVGYFEVF